MVSLNSNPRDGFYLDPSGMALPNIGLFSSPTTGNATTSTEDLNKKVRKPYTITKSRESWTEPEHDKFLEALQFFDRDWKKIEAFVGSKTVIQIRSHAQKYFLKAQKSGANEHLPPPRPKRKAAHPYPQKASKTSPVVTKERPPFQASPAIPDAGFVRCPDPSTLPRHDSASSMPGWTEKPLQGDAKSAGHSVPYIYSCGESTSRTRLTVLPDFAQVYSFIGSVFDPTVTGHLDKLKKMDPIDIETVALLMRNLSINLSSREFEDHRKILSSYEIDPEMEDALDLTDAVLGGQSEDTG